MSRDADMESMMRAGNDLFSDLATAERKAGRNCDLDDYAVRAEWSHLRSKVTPERQYQMYIDATFKLGDELEVVSSALVASGRTRVECLEMFHNWATDAVRDPNIFVVFRDKALKGEQAEKEAARDAAEMAEAAAANESHGKSVRERTQEWLAKKLDFKLRRDGMKDRKVML
jgi:hypothetical protein